MIKEVKRVKIKKKVHKPRSILITPLVMPPRTYG